jgi:hypothetical protein
MTHNAIIKDQLSNNVGSFRYNKQILIMKHYSRYYTQVFIKPLNFFENNGIFVGTQIDYR